MLLDRQAVWSRYAAAVLRKASVFQGEHNVLSDGASGSRSLGNDLLRAHAARVPITGPFSDCLVSDTVVATRSRLRRAVPATRRVFVALRSPAGLRQVRDHRWRGGPRLLQSGCIAVDLYRKCPIVTSALCHAGSRVGVVNTGCPPPPLRRRAPLALNLPPVLVRKRWRSA